MQPPRLSKRGGRYLLTRQASLSTFGSYQLTQSSKRSWLRQQLQLQQSLTILFEDSELDLIRVDM